MKINMDLKQVLYFCIRGIELGNIAAVKNLLEDCVKELETKDATISESQSKSDGTIQEHPQG